MAQKKDYFSEIIGYENIKNELRIIRDMLINPGIYQKMGAKMEKALLLYGNPGTGKTTMAECLIKSTGRKAFTCRKKASDGSFVDELVKVFAKAKEKAPSIVFLDDMDKYSDKNLKDSENAEEFVTIQACLDEIKDDDVFVIATVNEKRRLPDSLLRPGRFGKSIYISCR